ncbi:sensor histidine kinase [Blastococcus sp. Marseille-P5729]|uniref:sensor histidine kinase n=1 Tax=Blastococcus sp. Marseille-P5729 TaxID=2086582 RepID=UPI000D0FD7F4|nr:sensor histidine kinase [Blastococcus sp. Marseille-P5729]
MQTAPLSYREMTTRWVFVAIPLAALAVSTALGLAAPAPGVRESGLLLGLAALALAWEVGWFSMPVVSGRQPRAVAIYVVGFIAVAALLAAIQPWFGFFAWCTFLRIPLLSSVPLKTVATVAASATMALCQIGGASSLAGTTWMAWGALVVVNAVIGLAMIRLVDRGRADELRQAAQIGELERTNERLTAALRENERLRDELVEQARNAATAAERTRMAGELHDTIAQGLAGVVTQLEAAEHSDGDALARHLVLARDLARESLADARRSVRALQPPRLSAGRLGEALQALVDDWRRRSGVRIDLAVTGDPEPSAPDVEVSIYRTAQEALANAVRHSGATRIGLTLTYLGSDLVLDVRDDGRGFDPRRPPSSDGGFGLSAMRDRVARAGGRLEIESSANRGTTVTAVLPGGLRSEAI